MASPIQWTWTWAHSRRRWGTRKPGMLQSLGSGRVGHALDWTTTTTRCNAIVISFLHLRPPDSASLHSDLLSSSLVHLLSSSWVSLQLSNKHHFLDNPFCLMTDLTLPTKVRIVKAMVFSSSYVQMWVASRRRLTTEELMPLYCDAWESLRQQGDQYSPS